MDAQRTLEKRDGRTIPDAPNEIRAVILTRNESLRVPSAIAHYRRLGVDRFFVVDNGSTDGTLEYLLAQQDVHVFHTDDSYAETGCGLDWAHAMLDTFAHEHWALTLDADELFIYPHYETLGLGDFCRFLDGRGVRAVFALLLDMYSDKPIRETVHRPGESLIETCPYFDPGPYRARRARSFPHIQLYGGVRERCFWQASSGQSHPPTVSKVPLVKWRRGMRYTLSTHAMLPVPIADLGAALLHFKFLSDFHDRAQSEVVRGEHFDGAREYRLYCETLKRNPSLSLRDERSIRFQGSAQLVDLKLMKTTPEYETFVRAGEKPRGEA